MSNTRCIPHSQQMTLGGIIFILLSVLALIFLVHRTHLALDETRERLRNTEDTLVSSTKRFESMNEYKSRLEKAYLNLKTEKATLLESDRSLKQELSELKELYARQIQTLQDELNTCHHKASGGHLVGENPGNGAITSKIEFPSQLMPNISSSSQLNRHIRKFSGGSKSDPGIAGEDLKSKSLSAKDGAHHDALHSNNAKKGVSSNQPSPPQPSGDPNEDPAGNVFI